MHNSESKQKDVAGLRNGAISLILGIISIVLPYIIVIWTGTGISYGSALVFLLGMIVAGICAIFGLIFGIKGLKSTRRKLAIVGIAVCAVSLLLWTWDLLGWLMMGGLIYL